MCICNVSSLNYCLSILFFLSAFFFTHRLPLIEFNCLCSSNDDDSRLWAIFTLSLLLLLLCAATILSLSPSGVCTLCLFATGLTSFFTPTLIVRLHFSTGSLAVYLFILAANTFAFRFVPQLPKGTSVRQLLYIHMYMFTLTYELCTSYLCPHCTRMCELFVLSVTFGAQVALFVDLHADTF